MDEVQWKGPEVTEQGEFDGIELTIPAQPNLLSLVRMTAGVVAARADLDLDGVEDLRLAVDELCLPFMDPTGRLRLRYGWDGETIEISCTAVGRLGPGPGRAEELRDELSAQILDALVDEHGQVADDGGIRAWLKLRRPVPTTS
jgi:serine/threonine-protein kinase RsbW